ncbi:MAG TPA: hypothetical protein P5567_02500 [Kiritimatiellia bacterium]|nr:hypothetical protein [Kiritimatiellia bacterium]HRZ11302.1 hypothetical protein [Kiritimatiellia bacterium]HSA17147.1 hypothetical protein [Kiritimatiellia bacterium]
MEESSSWWAGGAADLWGALLFGALFLPLLGVAEWLRRRGSFGPEATRKLVHIGGGLLSLALPGLVRSPAVVLAMSAALSLLFLWAKRRAALASLHGVARRTSGTEYFPLAVFLVYVATYGQYWLYACSMLVLAVADAFAALIGSRYGRHRYEVEDEVKSVEGSGVFLLIAFLAILLPMLLLTSLPRVVCVLSALLVAVLVTGFEAVSMGGADNLFIPLGVAVILAKITTKPVPEIVYQNASLAALSLGLALAARRTPSFNAGGMILFALFVFGAWSLGSERWALPVLAAFVVYAGARTFIPGPGGAPARVRVRILFRVLVIPLLLLVTGNMLRRGPEFYAPFVTAMAVVLAFGLWNHVLWARRPAGARRRALLWLAALAAWAVEIVPAWLLLPGRPATSGLWLPAGLVLAASALDDLLLGPDPSFEGERAWPAWRLVLAAAAGAAVLLAQRAGGLAPWPYPP